jgi:branched-chain amino acid transport system substrate-binding protein
MKRSITIILISMFVFSLMLSACGAPPATTAAPPPPQATEPPSEEPVATEEAAPTEALAPTEAPAMPEEIEAIIGFTASVTGKLNVESTRQSNGLNLWMQQVNDAGGIKLADGSVVKFKAVSYDDESNNERIQELYTRLVTEDNANFLISPYSSGLADTSAIIAEQYEKVMITTGAASDGTYKKGYTLVFQAYTPASKYLTGAVDLLKATDSEAKKIAIVHENDKFSTDVATALNDYALAQGYEIVLFEGYDSGTTDFNPFINKIQESAPDAIMGGGHFQDGSTFAKQLFEKNVPVKFVSLLVAPPEPSFAELGDAAFGVIGPSQWEPLAAFTEEAAAAAGMEWFGPTGAEFVAAYTAAYGEEPSYHAAGGYVAGLLLQKAIESAGSIDTAAVSEALNGLNLLTFFGGAKFDTTAEAHGLQLGHSMVYIQWQKDADGNLVKQVVWPAEGVTAPTIYPLH